MFLKNENGRSMVEMLGVLAIMGVITLGGVAGYRTAMQRFRANAIVELIAEVSTVAQTRNTCIDQDDLEDDWGLPECVTEVKGAGNGQVKVIFKNESACDEIRQLVGTSFGPCKIDQDGNDIFFIPNRFQNCDNDGCEGCEGYSKASCFN